MQLSYPTSRIKLPQLALYRRGAWVQCIQDQGKTTRKNVWGTLQLREKNRRIGEIHLQDTYRQSNPEKIECLTDREPWREGTWTSSQVSHLLETRWRGAIISEIEAIQAHLDFQWVTKSLETGSLRASEARWVKSHRKGCRSRLPRNELKIYVQFIH